ncbi:hypothetical protein PAMP_012836 [Pampus punctatissimus]
MWRIILSVALFCCSFGSLGSVSCKNKNNAEVDWYIIYKAPKLKNKVTGMEYLYFDPSGMDKMEPSVLNYKPINDPQGVLANTLEPLFIPIRSMPSTFGFISYSDQPPGCNAYPTFGHSKGVVMVQKDNTGVWLLHSTPQFPFRKSKSDFYPKSGVRNAQTFICITFNYEQFELIGKHLQYIRAFPFEHDIPHNFHQELIDAANWVQDTPQNPWQQLVSTGDHYFFSVTKENSILPADGDLYVTISNLLNSDLKVQTWGCQKDRDNSYCSPGHYKVLNILSLKTDLGDWDTKNDHSKWCIATDNNKPWICIADVNRASSQYVRAGGALCFSNEALRLQFSSLIQDFEICKKTQNRMDIIVNTSICDTDPDSDIN